MVSNPLEFLKKWTPVILIAAIIFVESATPGERIEAAGLGNENLHISGHFLLFFFLTLSLFRATQNQVLSGASAFLYAITDEIHQLFVEGRSASFFDITTDGIGILISLGVIAVLRRSRCVKGDIKTTQNLARALAKKLQAPSVIALYGDLGSGKTTFTKFLVEELGFKDTVQSPTFVLVRHYVHGAGSIKTVNHVDLYRLTNLTEVKDAGLEEILSAQDSVTIVEWPEIVQPLLPKNTIKVYFSMESQDTRKICIKY